MRVKVCQYAVVVIVTGDASLIVVIATPFALNLLSRDPKSESLNHVIAVDTAVVLQAVSHVTVVVTVDLSDLDTLGAMVIFSDLGALG